MATGTVRFVVSMAAMVACAAVASAGGWWGEPPAVGVDEERAARAVHVYPSFEVGESRTFAVEQFWQETAGDGTVGPEHRERSTVKVTVDGETDVSWLITWASDVPVLGGLVLSEAWQRDFARLAREHRTPELRLELLPDGTAALINLEEARLATLRVIEQIVGTLLPDQMPEERATFAATAGALHADPQVFETLVLNQIGGYFGAYGYELAHGETLNEPDEMPNSLTDPVPAELTVTLLADTPREGVVTVREVRAVTPAGGKRMTDAMRERLGGLRPPEDPLHEDMRMELRIEAEWEYEVSSGWFTSVTITKRVTVVEGEERTRRVDRTTFKVVEPGDGE